MNGQKSNIGWYIAIGALLFVSWKKYKMFTTVELEPITFRFDLSKILQPKIFAKFTLNNPTSASAKLNSIFGEVVYYDNGYRRKLADVVYDTPITILAGARTSFELQVMPVSGEVITILPKLLKTKNRHWLKFEGKMNVDGIIFNQQISLLDAA